MKNQEYIEYTYLHRKVVMYLANKYIKKDKEKILKQIQYHDMDKLFMYLFYDKRMFLLCIENYPHIMKMK